MDKNPRGKKTRGNKLPKSKLGQFITINEIGRIKVRDLTKELKKRKKRNEKT